MNNRLQFRHHSEIFETREAAIEYIQNGIRKTDTGLAAEEPSYGFSLLAEPTVLLYKNDENETDPHMILAVGTCTSDQGQYGENRFCFIDVDNESADFEKYKEEIAALIKSITILVEDTNTLELTKATTESGSTISGNVKLADSYLFDNVKKGNIIFATENGLYTYVDVKFDKDNNKISYQINGNTDEFVIPNNYLVSGEYSVEDESLHFKLSESAEEVVVNLEALLDEWDVDKNPSTPIVLKKETIGYGSDTKQGHSTSSHLEPWQDILSADVTLSDSDYNILTKSNNGKALYVKGTADNIKYFKNGKEITVAQALDNCLEVSSDNENIIYKKEDGFAASVSIKYEKSENAIYFYKSNKKGEKDETKLALNSTNLTNSYYDPKTERIVLQFITATGDLDTRYIDLSNIFDLEWDVKNEGHSVALIKTRQDANKADILSADVKISDAENNILVEKDHTLYVKGTADNIKYANTTVKDEIDTITSDTKSIHTEIDKLSENVDKKLESISAADASIVVDNSSKLNPTVKVNVSEDSSNLIKLNADGINAFATLTYDESNNKIKFSTSAGDTEFQLQGLSFIDDARYDHQTEKIIITYHTNKGESKTLEIDVKDLIKEWDVTSDTSGAIKLSQSEDASTGRHIISAATIINTTHSDNMLVNDHGSLYVSSSKIDDNTKSIEKLTERVTTVEGVADAAAKKNEEQDGTLATLRTDLDAEVALQASHYKELFDEVASAKDAIATNKQKVETLSGSVATLSEKVATAESNIANVQTSLAQEISDREKAVSAETARAEKSENDLKVAADALTLRVAANETNIAANATDIKAISTDVATIKTDAVALEKRVATNEETLNVHTTSIATNASDIRTANENVTALTKRVSANETNIAANSTNISTVRDNLTTEISDRKIAVNTETTRAEAVESNLQNAINALSASSSSSDSKIKEIENNVSNNTKDIATNKNDIATNASSISELKKSVESISSQVDTNKANIASNKSLIDANAKDIATINSSLETVSKQVDTNKTDIASNKASIDTNTVSINSVKASVEKEISDRENADTTLSNRITDLENAKVDLEKSITSESNRASSAETEIRTALTAEATRATNEEDKLTKALNDEIQNRKDADSTLDAAIKKATSEFTDSTSIKFAKSETTDKTNYVASIKIATGENNILSVDSDGVLATVKLGYNGAKNTIWLEKDNGTVLSSEVQLNAGSIIDEVSYDKEHKIIKISYTTAQGESRSSEVPVSDLFNEWDVDNIGKTSGILLTKTTSATETGVDLLSAQVLISPIEQNIVKLDTNGLYVDGTPIKEISGNTECAQNEIDAIEDVLGVVGSCDTPIEYHKTAYQVLSAATSFTDADAKLESAILDTNKVFHDTVSPSAYIKVEDNKTTNVKDIKAYVRVSNNETNVITLVDTGNDADNANGLYLSNTWDCGTYEGGTEIDTDTYLKKFAN